MACTDANSSPSNNNQSPTRGGRSRAGSFSTLWSSADVPFLLDPRLNRQAGSSFVSSATQATPTTIRSSYFSHGSTEVLSGAAGMNDPMGVAEQIEMGHRHRSSPFVGASSPSTESPPSLPPLSSPTWAAYGRCESAAAPFPANACSSSISSGSRIPWATQQQKGDGPAYQKRKPSALNIRSISYTQWDDRNMSQSSALGTHAPQLSDTISLTAEQKCSTEDRTPMIAAPDLDRARSPTAEKLYMQASHLFQVDYSLGLAKARQSLANKTNRDEITIMSETSAYCEDKREQDSSMSLLSQSHSTISSDSMSRSRDSRASESSVSSFGFPYIDKTRQASGLPARGSARLSSTSSHPTSPSRQFRSLSNTSIDSSPATSAKFCSNSFRRQSGRAHDQALPLSARSHFRLPSSPTRLSSPHLQAAFGQADSVSHSTLILPAARSHEKKSQRTMSTDSGTKARAESPSRPRAPSWWTESKEKPLPSPLGAGDGFSTEADRSHAHYSQPSYPPSSSRTADLVAKQSRPRRGSLASSISSSISQIFQVSALSARASFGDTPSTPGSRPGSMAHGKSSASRSGASNWASYLCAGLTLHLHHDTVPNLHFCMKYLAYDPFGRPESLMSPTVPDTPNRRSRSKSARGKEQVSVDEQAGTLEFGADPSSGVQEYHFGVGSVPPVLRHLTIAEQATDLLTRQAALSLDVCGVHEVSGSERKGTLAWQFVYSVEERIDAYGHVIASERTLRPLRFSCSATLLDPTQARKSRLLKMVKKQVRGSIASTPIDATGRTGRRPSANDLQGSVRQLSTQQSFNRTESEQSFTRAESESNAVSTPSGTPSRLMSRLRKASFVGRPGVHTVSSPTYQGQTNVFSFAQTPSSGHSVSNASSSNPSPTQPLSPASAHFARLAPPASFPHGNALQGRKRGASLGESSRAYPIGLPYEPARPELDAVPGSDDSVPQVVPVSHRERDLPALPAEAQSHSPALTPDRPMTAAEQIKASWLSRERGNDDSGTSRDAIVSNLSATAMDDLQVSLAPSHAQESRAGRRMRSKTDDRDVRTFRLPVPDLPRLRWPEARSVKSRRSNRGLRSHVQSQAQAQAQTQAQSRSQGDRPDWLLQDDRFQPTATWV